MDPTTIARSLIAVDAVITDRLVEHLDPPVQRIQSLDAYGFDLSQFAGLNDGCELSPAEHVLILLALVPHVRPDFFGSLIGRYLPEGGDLPVFGGVRAEHHRGILPTGETAQFILAGNDLAERLQVQRLLSAEHWFARRNVLGLDTVREGEPVMSGRLILDPEVVEQITTGTVSLPRFGSDFPAEHIEDRDGVGRRRAARRHAPPGPRDRELDPLQ